MQFVQSEYRNGVIVNDIHVVYAEGRKIIVLTELTDHLERLRARLDQSLSNVFVLHGRLPKKVRESIFTELCSLGDLTPRRRAKITYRNMRL